MSSRQTTPGSAVSKRFLQTTPSSSSSRKKARFESDDDDEVMDEADDDPFSSQLQPGPKGRKYQVLSRRTMPDSESDTGSSEASTPPRRGISKGKRLASNPGSDADDDTPLPSVADGLTQVFQDAQNQHDNESQDQDSQSQLIQTQQTQTLSGKSLHDEYSERMIDAYKEGLKPFVKASLDLEAIPTQKWANDRRRPDAGCKYDDLVDNLALMLLQMNRNILEHVIKGDLPEAAKKDQDLANDLRKLKSMSKNTRCPSTYGQYLVDKEGISPTPAELKSVLEIVQEYRDGLQQPNHPKYMTAYKIDNVVGKKVSLQESKSGYRKYLKGKTQAEICDSFITLTGNRIEKLQQNQPLERPLAEIGYATLPIERLDQHKKHTSSNYLMNLTEAICEMHFKKKWFIEQYVLFKHTHYTHAMFAEIVLSAGGLVYIHTGGGFSHHPAGISHQGAEEKNNEEGYYEGMEDDVLKSSMFEENVLHEIQKGVELQEAYEGMYKDSKEANRLRTKMIGIVERLDKAHKLIEHLNLLAGQWKVEAKSELDRKIELMKLD